MFRFKDPAPYYLVLCYFCQFKIGQDQKIFYLLLRRFWQLLPKRDLWKGDWLLACVYTNL